MAKAPIIAQKVLQVRLSSPLLAGEGGLQKEIKDMALSHDTLKAMIRDYQGFPLSDDELELIQPELDSYLQAIEQLQELDLSAVFSSRLLRVQEGGQS